MAKEQGKGDKRRQGKGYGDAYDRIFGIGAKATTSRVIIDSRTRKTIEVVEGPRNRLVTGIIGDIDPFLSPITGEVISSRSTLRAHNKEHGVTDHRDYSPEYWQKKQVERSDAMTGNTRTDKESRIERLKQASEMDRFVPNKGRRR